MNAPPCSKCGGKNVFKGTQLMARGRIRRVQCKSCGYKGLLPLVDFETDQTGQIQIRSRYVITSAVNDTPLHKAFLQSLQHYCNANDAQLLVIPLRYKNPTSQQEKGAETYAPEIVPYLFSARAEPIPGLKIMGDIKTQPTAVRPLSGLDSLTGTACGIFGHTKVAMESVATKGQQLAKLLYTTGAVTKSQFSDTKAGKKGEFHHSLGAVVVERDGELFHIRQLLAQNNGSFYDLDKFYTKDGVREGKPIAALVAGDIHAERADPDCIAATFTNNDSIAATLRPNRIVLHDVLDFGSASHHNSFFEKFRRHHSGRGCIRSELDITFSLMDEIAGRTKEVVVVDSNHNGHFLKWLGDGRNADDLQNAEIFAETRAGILPEFKRDGFCDPLEWWARTELASYKKTRFLKPGESYTVHGVELAYHGDQGPNGARGSAIGFSRIGAKTIIGHSHSPRIVDGCYQTGTSSLLDMGYNLGSPSSWVHSHVVEYANGKRTHVHVIGGRWRA